ncbi:uncharacterized protein [Eurosta solidaginis]|uniref:uncharacterized protein isoform X1 n=1 Tax=Eurosta solidaginis TaxID=178769 RepID=UPI003530E5CE
MLELGVIEEAPSSAWSSPGVLIVKPGKVRFCLDSRKLNEVTLKDAHPIPIIEGLLSRLPPVHYISKIDLKDAFWQIGLEKQSREKTAFTVPNRPFGLCNAPQTMCRLMDKVIPYNLKNNVFVYLDDLLVVSSSFNEHLVHLSEVSALLRKAGLTINIRKSKFGLSQVNYLGFVVGNGSLQVDKEKISAIQNYPIPKTVRQLRRFLGMTGWYRRFIDDYASTTFHLTELLSKKKQFVWNSEAQQAFEDLKEKLTSAPILLHPNYNKPFILQCDASQVGVGACLMQEDDNGQERPIAYMSQKLNKAQRNYSVTELECLAVVLAIKRFRMYIEGMEFKVVTDHASLRWLMQQQDLSGRLARWAIKLQGFNFSIEHKKGSENVIADALSRMYEDVPESEVNVIELPVLPEIDLGSDAFNSPEYEELKLRFQSSNLPDFQVIDGYIYHRTEFATGNSDTDDNAWKLYVPTELRHNVISAAHEQPSAAHGGIAKTVERIRRRFYWPGMVIQIREYVLSCESCQTSKTPSKPLRPPMGQQIVSDRPFQILYMDLIGPFPRSKKGNIGLLIVLDHLTKFVFLKPVKKFTSNLIMEYLKENIFDSFGIPESVVTDNGSQFKSKDFEHFLQKYGVSHITTAVYSPQSNASERVNRSINEALRSYIRKDQRDWDAFTSSINCALRNSLHQSLGYMPYFAVFGQHMITHAADYKLLRNLNLLSDNTVKLERSDNFQLIREVIKKNLEKAHLRNANS